MGHIDRRGTVVRLPDLPSLYRNRTTQYTCDPADIILVSIVTLPVKLLQRRNLALKEAQWRKGSKALKDSADTSNSLSVLSHKIRRVVEALINDHEYRATKILEKGILET